MPSPALCLTHVASWAHIVVTAWERRGHGVVRALARGHPARTRDPHEQQM